MNIILPQNRNVTPVVLPCVAKVLPMVRDVNIEAPVTDDEVLDGEQIIRKWYSPWINLDTFAYAYYMGDGITKAIDLTKLQYSTNQWGVLDGDYEWPLAFGNTKKVRTIEQLTEGINYLTQPFAGTGALWSTDQLSTLGTVVLDMAYISTCKPKQQELPSNVDRVFVGASKSLGTPFLRHGWLFSRVAIPELDLFFKSIKYFSSFGFRAGIALYKAVDPFEQYDEGFYCKQVISHSNLDYNLQGDSWLIAYTEKTLPKHLKRGSVYRIPLGLTIQQMLL